jgi:hypothetical protein
MWANINRSFFKLTVGEMPSVWIGARLRGLLLSIRANTSKYQQIPATLNSQLCQYTPLYNTKPTHFYSNIRIVTTMPNLRLVVYLADQQYAGMTDHAHDHAANNTTAEIPSINQEQTRLPIADAPRNASSNKPPAGV